MKLNELLTIIACPGCRGTLKLDDDELCCTDCGTRYAMQNSTPILFPKGSTFISQSGALSTAILLEAASQGIFFNMFYSDGFGNSHDPVMAYEPVKCHLCGCFSVLFTYLL